MLHDASGQVLLFGAILVSLLFVFMLVIPNGTRVATQKMRAQTAADVGAFTGSVWLARALNLNANLNVGIKSMYTWVTVLTVGSALAAGALQRHRASTIRGVHGDGTGHLLLRCSEPATPPTDGLPTSSTPLRVDSLNSTAHWLSDLQDDIVATFHEVAADAWHGRGLPERGREPAVRGRRRLGAGQEQRHDRRDTPARGGPKGDSLMYSRPASDRRRPGESPTGNPNIGPAVGTISD